MPILEQPQKRKPKCHWHKCGGLSWSLSAVRTHTKCSCSSIRSLLFVCTKLWRQQVCLKQPLNIKTWRPNWTHLWIRITRFEGLSWSLHARRRCVLELAWDLCVVPWRKNDQNISLKVKLFLCWFCFVLCRAFSDDTNSKQKTPHKEPCAWQISCWWDIRSLNYHSNQITHELFTKWNPLV